MVTSAATITTNAQSSSSIPMKVVFVNALNSNTNAQQTAVKQQQFTLNKSLAQLQNQTPNSNFLANKIISTNQQKMQLVNQLPSPNFNTTISAAPTKINPPNIITNNHNNHDKHRSGGKSSKSILGNKLPGKNYFYDFLLHYEMF